jgi:hypothetical protein
MERRVQEVVSPLYALRPLVQQKLHRIDLPLRRRQMQRRFRVNVRAPHICFMLHQEFHGVEIALCSFIEGLSPSRNRIDVRAVLENRPHGRDVVADGIPVQRWAFDVINPIRVSVVVQEQLHHLGRPRRMHGAELVLAVPVDVLDLGAIL